MGRLWTMTASDLRQRLRDRSVIIFAVVVPLALMSVLHLVIPSDDGVELDPVTVAASVPDGDPMAQSVVDVLAGLSALQVTVDQVDAEEARAQAEDGTATVALVLPDGFSASLQAGETAEVRIVEGDGAGIEADIVISIVQATLARMDAATVATHAGADLGVPPAELGALAEQVASSEASIQLTEGVTATEQLDASGALVAGQAGLFLLFTVGFGVLGLVTEREQGTLARLRSMPMPTWQIAGAKALTSFVLGIVATTVLLVAGSLLFGVDFGDPVAIGVLVVSVTIAGTAIMLVIARVTRTSEQAGIAQTITAMLFGIAGGAFFPMAGSGWYGRLLDLNPIGAFIRGLGITSGGGGLGAIAWPVVTMLGFAIVVGALSRLVPDRGTAL